VLWCRYSFTITSDTGVIKSLRRRSRKFHSKQEKICRRTSGNRKLERTLRETVQKREYKVLSESVGTVIVVNASAKEDEMGGQGHISTTLLQQSST
jgi:hypothetical protein